MKILGLTIGRTKTLELQQKALVPQLSGLSSRGGWWSWVREPFTGAWQQNAEIRADTVLTYFAVFACVTLIASDIAKLCLRLVEKDKDGIWTETDSPSFSPVLRKPNRYQTTSKFVEQWIVSKLLHGNAYILKQRDNRGIVVAMYVLDPLRVTPLVSPDGAVYYELKRDDLSELKQESVVVPAREIIHDTMVSLYHPLIGVSPIFACGLAATQGLSIQNNSAAFFANGSNPGGIITVPGAIPQDKADALKLSWETNYGGDNAGRVALLTDGMKYDTVGVNATDSQLIEQLKWTADVVCSCYHVAPYMIGVGPPPPYANVEPLLQQYYSQCLQGLINSLETHLDEGLEMPKSSAGKQYGTEFDIGDLIWMDTATKTKAAGDSIGAGAMTINEARKRYFGLGTVTGGDTCYLQQQNYSLAALAERDASDPFAKPAPAAPPVAPDPAAADDEPDMAASFGAALHRKMTEAQLYG